MDNASKVAGPIGNHDGIFGSLDPTNLSEAFLVAVGVILATLASFLTCLGLAVQKTSLCAPQNANVDPWQQPRWIMGFFCLMLGNVIDFLSFGLAPQSLLAPLAALSLVWNLFVSAAILGEKYDRNDIVASVLIFSGTALTVLFSNHHERKYSLDVLRDLYHKQRMVAYAIITPALLAFHYWLIRVSKDKRDMRSRLIGLVGWCGFSGIMGGNSVLFAKSSVELLKDAFFGENVFFYLHTYVIVTAMVVCLLLQIHFLNGAMLRFEQLHVLPVYQSYWIISGVIAGLVYFGEFEDLTSHSIWMFLVGVLVALLGLYQLTKKSGHSLHAKSAGGFDVLPNEFVPDQFVIDSTLADELGIELRSDSTEEFDEIDGSFVVKSPEIVYEVMHSIDSPEKDQKKHLRGYRSDLPEDD